MKTLLQSLLDELCGLIRRNEKEFASSVIGDLLDAINRSEKPEETALQWLRQYKSLSY